MREADLALSSLVAVHSRARGAHHHLATSSGCSLRIALPFDMLCGLCAGCVVCLAAGVVQDTLLGCKLITQRDTFITRDVMMNILMNIQVSVDPEWPCGGWVGCGLDRL